MKVIRHTIAILACTAALAACNEDLSKYHYDNKIYIETSSLSEEVLFKATSDEDSRTITVRTAAKADNEITGRLVLDTALVSKFNMAFAEQAVPMADSLCEIDGADIVIKEGTANAVPAEIRFRKLGQLSRDTVYVMPVSLVDVQGIGVLESKSSIYFVFKGASLINVVADIAQNNFPVEWKNSVSDLKTITVEALIRVRDFGNVGGLKGEAMSTVFGIEGNFLLRIGDAGFPQNQLQLVNPNGNFPDGNSQLGLPNNEWVHVAAVWDATTGDRIIYHNGKEMARDSKASGSVDLTDGDCYIGKAWNDSRWLDGEICELRIWNIQRTAEELAANIYEVDPASEGLLAYWKFNEGQGKVVADHSGNGNDVTAENDLKWTKVSLPENN